MIDFLSGRAKLIIALLAALVVVFVLFARRDYTGNTERLDSMILETVRDSGVPDSDFVFGKQEKGKSGGRTFLKITRRYEVSRSFDLNRFQSEIDKKLRKTGFKTVKSVFEKRGEREEHTVYFSFKNRIIYEISFLKKAYGRISRRGAKNAKIAIVLDDFGYNMNNLETLYGINAPITISILPNITYSKRIAEEASAKNIEILLHLPLEPRGEEDNLEPGTIKVGMPPREVKALLKKAIESVPRIKGVSNHMGSKATEDKELMKVIFDELKKRRLYFMDSLVTDSSMCEVAALKSGLRIATRDVFLDNESDERYIENQLRRTAEIAAKSGSAVGLGHDRPNTIRVLAKIIPELKSEGFQFVYLSELVK
ncbi:MAG: divergent polysaccharide deacetylase family protein [Candidatus Omnitrophica bacterium]|nr:divergent polysaccharide deacetylase family protein [Candidatus Omnitrophota bacterium]MBU4488029.1 divergent polysaccharide deacetylase family protein [Candidatus Omnitrophota bacterium]MCG2704729.1 divergent polysaccharide deacetylase family protein [Candidatus Omnitrophota bacterium]